MTEKLKLVAVYAGLIEGAEPLNVFAVFQLVSVRIAQIFDQFTKYATSRDFVDCSRCFVMREAGLLVFLCELVAPIPFHRQAPFALC